MGRGHQAGSLGLLRDRILTAVGGEKNLQCSIFNKLYLSISEVGRGSVSGAFLGSSGAWEPGHWKSPRADSGSPPPTQFLLNPEAAGSSLTDPQS